MRISEGVEDKMNALVRKELIDCDGLNNRNLTVGGFENILVRIFETVKNLNNNGSILLVTNSGVEDNYLFKMILQEMLNKNIKFYVIIDSFLNDDPILNLKKIAFITDGYFYNVYGNPKTTHTNVLNNEGVTGQFRFNVTDDTQRVFIRILGTIEDIGNPEVITPSGKKSRLFDLADTISLGNVYFTTLKVHETGLWTISLDAKKRVSINVINENIYQFLNEVHFSKLVAPEKIMPTLPAVTIDVGTRSELLSTPNKNVYVYFEVTNNQDQVLNVRFQCTDTKYMLLNMQPGGAVIQPNQTEVVTITLQTGIPSGNFDTITFAVVGLAQKAAYLFVNNEKPIDVEGPHLRHTLTSNCGDVSTSDCNTATWSAEIFAQDKETGLLQLKSEPRGIYFNSDNFISGTKEEVVGYYVGSCCKSNLEVVGFDLNGNKITMQIDAYSSTTLGAGVISAIVLGVILLIVAIIVIVYFVIKRKQQDSLDLPTYRGPSSSRTPL